MQVIKNNASHSNNYNNSCPQLSACASQKIKITEQQFIMCHNTAAFTTRVSKCKLRKPYLFAVGH